MSNSQHKVTLAIQFFQAGNFEAADQLATEILLTYSESVDALHLRGVIAGLQNRHTDAESFLLKAANLSDDNHHIFFNLAKALSDQGKNEESLKWHLRALELHSEHPHAWLNYGISLFQLDELDRAVQAFDRALFLNSDFAEAYSNKANCLVKKNMLDEALLNFNHALALNPNIAEVWSNRSIVLNSLKRYEEALASCDRANALKPNYAAAWNNRSIILMSLKRYEEALASCDRAIELKLDYPEAWNNRGLLLNDLRRHEEALASYDRAIKLRPDHAEAWNNRGVLLDQNKNYEEALTSYERAYQLNPKGDFWLGNKIHARMKICDWSTLDSELSDLSSGILRGEKVSMPFLVAGLFDSLEIQRQVAEIFAKEKLQENSKFIGIKNSKQKDKIRLGYFSADFHNHATMYLMAELFELHDKKIFEIYGFSFGPNQSDEMRERVVSSFDRFIDVTQLSDSKIAALSREYAIDIAIDLKGYTRYSRPQIFAARAAPIQINYLGYPGTMGTQHLDYLIADHKIIPPDARDSYTEKIVYLPNSYQINDSNRQKSNRTFSREEVNLPAKGFVFCCFNNNWKILPDVFECWMRILKSVEHSVLWLYQENPIAAKNLRREARLKDIDPKRIIFAETCRHAEHLARYALADLFLDTFPYNAHTTGSDALWSGVPILTIQGRSFPSRVGSSLLESMGLSELITYTLEEYESAAIELALDSQKFNFFKTKVIENRSTTLLFNARLTVKNIESAYQTVYNRYQAGEAPDHVFVNP